MPSATSTGNRHCLDLRAAVLLGAIALAGMLGESGMDWRKCSAGADDLISACALEVDVLPNLVRSAYAESGNG